ncbi:MAG: cation:proton antiporter [Thermodesulfobacteriota bacterium]
MTEHLLIGIASIVVLGVGAQWLAWRMGLPAILLLLIIGFVAGPVTGFLDPDEIFGDLLLPIVSISVALILFEGGLTLRVSELKGFGGVVRNLVTIGVVVTWLIGSLAAGYLLGLDLALSVLVGAVLVVTGPTVIVPLLRHVRPVGHLGSILKWEGIVIDPIGAMLAVRVFEGIVAGGGGGGLREAGSHALMGIVKTILAGGLTGAAGAALMVFFLRRYWIPDFLQNPVTVMVVVGAFAASNYLQAESGLLAVTVMGIALANQKAVTVKHIVEFKENLRVLLISSLFILLAARLDFSDFSGVGVGGVLFLLVLIVAARPLSVFFSTLGSGLSGKEKIFLGCMAPRGIVAAAIASVFSMRLVEAGHAGAEMLVPITFMVIIGTVAVYGLGALPVARSLGLSSPNPQGVLFAGAHPWAREIAAALSKEGFEVMLVDNNWTNVSKARLAGLPAHYGSILAESLPAELELGGIGRLLALTHNDNVNSLAALHFTDAFGRKYVYQLPPEDEGRVSQTLRGRLLFGSERTYSYLARRFASGAVVKTTKLTGEFGFEAFRKKYAGAVPLFLITEKREVVTFATDNQAEPKPGQTLISVVDEEEG